MVSLRLKFMANETTVNFLFLNGNVPYAILSEILLGVLS